jgi:hypothetical protein
MKVNDPTPSQAVDRADRDRSKGAK